ncbi:DNA-protecting protein DprA [Candidatus Parcubacteria bacterium]|nr:MAG: DNA-protecting protein DprA [Candidatus Parcubacteria bacterium]
MKSDFRLKNEENFYLYFLSNIKGLSHHNIWQWLNQRPNDKIEGIIKEKEKDEKFISQAQENFLSLKEPYISILDPEYPALLKTIYDPPLFLFYRGNKKLLQAEKLLTIVGSRTTTDYHTNSARKIIAQLKDTPLVIVSGLAIGLDALAHQAALENKLPTIAVLGSGLDDSVLYPKSNLALAKKIIEQNGLLLSEYPALTPPALHQFPRRNRLLAGLSQATLVISGALKSGTLITAQVAIDEGREVLALPGNINYTLNQGPNKLLKSGADIFVEIEDILQIYKLDKKIKSQTINLKNKSHAKIYSLLQTEPMSLIRLSQKTELPLDKLNPIISEMEINGLVKFNRFDQLEIL